MRRLILILSIAIIACGAQYEQKHRSEAIFPIPINAPIPIGGMGTPVTITATSVHIRTADGVATGEYAMMGDFLKISEFRQDGWAVISYPNEWAGFILWRGCTSSPAEFGCMEAK
ncbi:MAG: hypothetical protein ONA90_06290 [candidate division KSB1 bacterium]|nr:hypothetical protein [candidate division KSB1 bacterium]